MASYSKANLEKIHQEVENYIDEWTAARSAGDTATQSSIEDKIYSIEKRLRNVSNRRLKEQVKLDIGIQIGWFDNILKYIEGQHFQEFFDTGIEKKRSPYRLIAPRSFAEAQESILAEMQFLRLKASTWKGAIAAFEEIKERAYIPDSIKGNDDAFISYWAWRQRNPVHEFFKLYPPSPPELRSSVGTMAVDIWNSAEVEKSMINALFDEYQKYLDAEKEGFPEGHAGLSSTELVAELDRIYEEKLHRARSY